MKKIMIVLFVFVSLSAGAQNKADSIKQVMISIFIDSVKQSTSLQTFLVWSYDRVSAKTFQDFTQIINLFIEEKYRMKKP